MEGSLKDLSDYENFYVVSREFAEKQLQKFKFGGLRTADFFYGFYISSGCHH